MKVDDETALDVVLGATGMSKRYGHGSEAIEALQHVSVAFETGTFTAVMGPSGSGKPLDSDAARARVTSRQSRMGARTTGLRRFVSPG